MRILPSSLPLKHEIFFTSWKNRKICCNKFSTNISCNKMPSQGKEKHNMVVESIDSGSWLLEVKLKFCHILAVWTWTSYITSLCFRFLASRMRTIIRVPPPQRSCEEYIRQSEQCPANSKHSINVSYYYYWICVNFICIRISMSISNIPRNKDITYTQDNNN